MTLDDERMTDMQPPKKCRQCGKEDAHPLYGDRCEDCTVGDGSRYDSATAIHNADGCSPWIGGDRHWRKLSGKESS